MKGRSNGPGFSSTLFAVLLCVSTSVDATTYTWTGAVSGDWADAGNWDTNGVPVDTNPGGGLELNVSSDRIVIDAAGGPRPVPTLNIPVFGGTTTGGLDTPQLDLGNGAFSVSVAGYQGGVAHANATWITTVGDGDLDNGPAVLNYNMNTDWIDRHNNGGVRFTVEEDGELNIINGKAVSALQFSFGGAGHPVDFTVGGTLSFNMAVQLDGLPGNFFTLTSQGASVTASFGGSYTNLAAVQARIGNGFDFRTGGPEPDKLILFAKDNKDNTFTVRPKPPQGTVVVLY